MGSDIVMSGSDKAAVQAAVMAFFAKGAKALFQGGTVGQELDCDL